MAPNELAVSALRSSGTSTMLSQAAMSCTEIDEDFGGRGEALYFGVDQVAETARELDRANLESEVTVRFDPARIISALSRGDWTPAAAFRPPTIRAIFYIAGHQDRLR